MLLRLAYYKRFGIRKQSELTAPELHSVNLLALPRESIFHYFSNEPTGFGMAGDDPILNGYELKFAMMSHVTEFTDAEAMGRFREVPNAVRPLMMKYHSQNRRFRLARDYLSAMSDPRMLMIFNYAPLHLAYKYMDTPLSTYHEWYNRYRTLWATIARVATESNRQQYVIMDIPAVQPPPTELVKYENHGMTTTIMNGPISRADAFQVADFWAWLGVHRDKSAINQVREIDLSRVNLIFMELGRWTVLNLGILNSWREREEAEGELDIEIIKNLNKGIYTETSALDTLRLQRRALRFFMALNEATLSVNSLDGDEEEIIAEPPVVERDDNGQLVFNREPEQKKETPSLERPVAQVHVAEKKTVQARLAQTHEQALMESKKNLTDDVVSHTGPESEEVYSDEDVERDLERLELIAKEKLSGEQFSYKPYTPPEKTLEGGVLAQADEMVKKGLLSPAQYRRMEKLSQRYKELDNPFGEGKFEDLLTIKPEEVAVAENHPMVPDIKGVSDKSFLSSSLKELDKAYCQNILKKDLVKMTMSLQKAGIAVQDYTVDVAEDYNDHFEVHTIRVQPVVGKATTLRFRLPVVDGNGNFKVAGVMNRLRFQRGDLPIRKIAPDEVALTSYYSKLFINRAERAVFNYENWLSNLITARGMDDADVRVTELRFGKAFQSHVRVPRQYSSLSKRFLGFRSGDVLFDFMFDKRIETYGAELVAKIDEQKELVLCGKSGKDPIVMNMENKLFRVVEEGKKLHLHPIPDMETMLGADKSRAPIEIAEVGLFAKAVPVGFVLGYIAGLGDLLATLKVPYRRERTRSHYKVGDDEFDVRFEDETLVFKREPLAMLIFGGFNRYHRDIKRLSIYSFDKKDIYTNILENNGISSRSSGEIDLMFKMWVDHITEEILTEMGEPTDLFNLIISAVKKLEFDDHPDPMDNLYMRDKGYERFAGLMYSEVVKALRVYNGKPKNANASLDLNPEAVWQTLLADATVLQVEDSNPIANLQEKEVVVYRGAGGRSARSMTAKFRSYHKNGLGVVSEANVDNGDVATITYTTADPNYRSLRGTIRKLDKVEGNTAKVLSTSTLLAPGATTDDPKRIAFIGIQNKQTTHILHATPMPLRTDYERVMAHRVDDLYAKTADEDGEVIEVTPKAITVKYKSGELVSYEIGRRFGTWAGEVIPHAIKTNMKAGEKFKKGAVLSFNTNFFKQDTLDPSQVLQTNSVLGLVALVETPDTLEDSCAISEEFAQKIMTNGTHIRGIKVAFEQEVRNLLREGSTVDVDTVVCTLENKTAGRDDLFDEKALETLKLLSALTPKAKAQGKIEKIEVLYAGEIEDMSPSLRQLAETSDRELYRYRKQLRKRAITGQVEPGYRIDGQIMENNSAVIRVYITGDIPAAGGDKVVFANQLKSIIGRVMQGENKTESGLGLDAHFSYQSVQNRIVNSPMFMGTTNRLLVAASEAVVAAYEK